MFLCMCFVCVYIGATVSLPLLSDRPLIFTVNRGCVFYLMLEGKPAFNYSVPRRSKSHSRLPSHIAVPSVFRSCGKLVWTAGKLPKIPQYQSILASNNWKWCESEWLTPWTHHESCQGISQSRTKGRNLATPQDPFDPVGRQMQHTTMKASAGDSKLGSMFDFHSIWDWRRCCEEYLLPRGPKEVQEFIATLLQAGWNHICLVSLTDFLSPKMHGKCHRSRFRWTMFNGSARG